MSRVRLAAVKSSELAPSSGRRSPTGINLEPIMAAAEDAFAELGFHGASMRTIAKTAGTSLSNLYNYFPSKADLLLAVLDKANSVLQAQIATAVRDAHRGPADQLREAVRAYVNFAVNHRSAAIVALSEFRYLQGTRRAKLVEARDRTQRIFEEITESGVKSGEFTTDHAADATRAILLLCATVPNWHRESGKLTRAAVAEMQAEFALSLVGATG